MGKQRADFTLEGEPKRDRLEIVYPRGCGGSCHLDRIERGGGKSSPGTKGSLSKQTGEKAVWSAKKAAAGTHSGDAEGTGANIVNRRRRRPQIESLEQVMTLVSTNNGADRLGRVRDDH